MAGLPYVGSGVFASAASMDKEFTKKLLAAAGLPQGDHVVLRDADGRGLRRPRACWTRRPASGSGCRCS